MNRKYIVIGLAMLVLSSLIYYFARESGKNSVKRELVYYVDSLTTYKNKSNEEYKQRMLIEHDRDALRTKFAELEQEYKKLKDNPLVITKVVTTTKIDTLRIPLERTTDTTFNYAYHKTFTKNDMVKVEGSVDITKMENHITTIELTSGFFYDIVEDKNGVLSVLVRSTNPLVTIDKIEGALFDLSKSKFLKKRMEESKKRFSFFKRFSISAYAGYGATIYNQSVILTPQVGVGIAYRIF